MGLNVILEYFDGEEIKRLTRDFRPCPLENFKSEKFSILKYIDPYDDTTLNSLMCRDLIADLKELRNDASSDKEQIDELLELAKICLNEPHSYIKFYGD